MKIAFEIERIHYRLYDADDPKSQSGNVAGHDLGHLTIDKGFGGGLFVLDRKKVQEQYVGHFSTVEQAAEALKEYLETGKTFFPK